MWIAISSLATVVLLCLFIAIAIYLGTVAAMVIVAATCTAVILGGIGLLLGVIAVVIEAIERRREVVDVG